MSITVKLKGVIYLLFTYLPLLALRPQPLQDILYNLTQDKTMSAQSDIRSTGETKERSDAINRIMKKYELENFELQRHVAKLHQLTGVLVLALVCVVNVSWWVVHKSGANAACEQQSYTQAQPTHKKSGLDYTIKP